MSDIEGLLTRTSRTFALAIPLLGDPPRREVGTAYLLFRIADTFEDAASWPAARRIEALAQFRELVADPKDAAARARALVPGWLAQPPCEHEGYLELLREVPGVLAEVDTFRPSLAAIVRRHTIRTTEGMSDVVARGGDDGTLRLTSLEDLRGYCYIVAGIVGELLTELFLDVAPDLEPVSGVLWRHAAAFGEGLQLVNILKDADDDARDGRVYLPPGVDRSRVLALARDDLDQATEYVHALQRGGAPRGIVAFTAFPVLLARATLDRIERLGAGAKIRRDEVMGLMGQLWRDLDAGAPALARAS